MVRRNIRVRSSHRTTFAHWLIRIGKSRYDCTQLAYIAPMIVSLVGRTISGSSSCAEGAGRKPPFPSGSSRWCVTTAHSLANPSTCSASFSRKLSGMNSGKYAFSCPVALNIPSSPRCMFSQIA